MEDLHRLYVITGKGGVGKTTSAISFCHFLKKKGKKVLFVALEDQKVKRVLRSFDLDFEILNIKDCVKGYISKKLGSETIAQWILSTPFFMAQLNMVPGFNYIIYMGYLMERLTKDEDLIIVMDSPSSGHTITMFESFRNFKDIFNKGFIADDIQKMLEFKAKPNTLKVNICCFPTLMAIHEGVELKRDLEDLNLRTPAVHLNTVLGQFPEIIQERENLPPFLKSKLDLEEAVSEEFSSQIKSFLPYSSSLEYKNIIEDLTPHMEKFL